MKPYSLRESLSDPDLLAHAIPGPSWSTWRTLLIAAFGEKLTTTERRTFTKFTLRQREPLQRVGQFAAVAGRRAGKTQAVAAAGTYLAAVCDHRGVLSPGETGVLLCLAQDQRIAKKILDYVESNLRRSKILRQRFVARTQDSIELNNSIRIEVRPASFRKLRGPTYIGIIADELAFCRRGFLGSTDDMGRCTAWDVSHLWSVKARQKPGQCNRSKCLRSPSHSE